MSYKQKRLDEAIKFFGLNEYKSVIYNNKRYQFMYRYQGKKYVLVGDGNEVIPVVEMPLIDVASIKPYVWTIDEEKIKKLKELNKYNLKPTDIKKAKLINSEKIKGEPLWRNDAIKAWCLSGGVGHGLYKGYNSDYWIGFYDDGKIDYHLNCMEDMCNYKISEFFNINDIEYEVDELLQVKYLEALNWLVDEKIIKIGE